MRNNWYLVRTRPLSEYMAAAALERSGHEFYFPLVKTPRPRIGYNDAPLFPGYLFVRHKVNGSGLPVIRRMAGIVGWVQFDGFVPSVPDCVITDLAQRVEALNRDGGDWTRYRLGQKVQVVSGKVESVAEVLEEPKSPQSRIRVLLNFMGRLVPARVSWHDLRPISDESASLYGWRRPRRTRGNGRWVHGFGPRAASTGPRPDDATAGDVA